MKNGRRNPDFTWVKRTLAGNFPDLEVRQVQKLGEGWRSRAFLVNRELVFRFPKETEGALETEKEIRALPYLRSRLTLAVPDFYYCGRQENGYPFVGYRILPGDPLEEERFPLLAEKIKLRLAGQIAAFIRELRAVSVPAAKELRIPEHDFYQGFRDLFLEAKEKAFPLLDGATKRYLTEQFTVYLQEEAHFRYTPVLLHGDLSLDHLLFDPEKQELTGVIDFGDLQIGDPDYEYRYLLEECGPEFTRTVMELLKERDIPARLEKLAFLLTADNVLFLLEGLKQNDRAMAEEGVRLLQEEALRRA